MSSSDSKIIKDAKLSENPVIIAMHDFDELKQEEAESYEEPITDLIGNDSDINIGPAETKSIEVPPEPLDVELIRLAQEKAEELLQMAQQQAENIKNQSAQESAQLKEQAKEEGRSQGYDLGYKQGLAAANDRMKEQLTQTSERCNAMILASEQEYSRIVQEAEPQIIELVLAICRKIIVEEVGERPSAVLAVVREALQRVRDQKQIVIHVSPDDYDFILAARRELQSVIGAEQSLSITADPVLNKGGCLIETSFGTVEAGIDTQLDSIRKVLQGMLP